MASGCVKNNSRQETDYDRLNALSDEGLLLLLRDGNGDSLAVLFDRYHRLVMSVALRILRDAGEAEDLVQSVFLEIFRSAAQFDANKGTAKVWILQYAYHRSFNRRQYLARRGNYSDSQEAEALAVTASTSYWRAMDSLELKRMLEEILGRLSPLQRMIFELVFHDGLTMREIAETTGKSFDSVRHQYYRGMETLRSIWCEEKVSPVISVLGGERLVGS
jgi:RNA polymerase sigma-70 factor (ECF subfamily)